MTVQCDPSEAPLAVPGVRLASLGKRETRQPERRRRYLRAIIAVIGLSVLGLGVVAGACAAVLR